jgi:5-methylcytosine-specific restriction endonuclease McrA
MSKYNYAFKQLIGEKFNFECGYCGKKLVIDSENHHKNKNHLTVDHLTPLSRGGADSAKNLVICCKSCNSSKGTKTAEEYKNFIVNNLKFTEEQLKYIMVTYGYDIKKDIEDKRKTFVFPYERVLR